MYVCGLVADHSWPKRRAERGRRTAYMRANPSPPFSDYVDTRLARVGAVSAAAPVATQCKGLRGISPCGPEG